MWSLQDLERLNAKNVQNREDLKLVLQNLNEAENPMLDPMVRTSRIRDAIRIVQKLIA